MDQHSYEREIKAAYDGELWGEAFFVALAAPHRSADQRRRLLVLAKLENETGRAVRPLVDRLGLEPGDVGEQSATGAEYAKPWRDLNWLELAAKLKRMIAPYVEKYSALADAAAPEDKAVLQRLAAHELALLRFAEAELTGQSDRSLDPVIALLETTEEAPASS